MKPAVIREMTTQELKERLVEEKNNYSKMKMGHTISPLENPVQLRGARKVIARLNTELKRRQLEDIA